MIGVEPGGKRGLSSQLFPLDFITDHLAAQQMNNNDSDLHLFPKDF